MGQPACRVGWALATRRDDETDSILSELFVLASNALRWEHAEWAQRASDSWLERGIGRPVADVCCIGWNLVGGNFAEAIQLGIRLDPDAIGLGPTLVAYILHELEQIAATNADGG